MACSCVSTLGVLAASCTPMTYRILNHTFDAFSGTTYLDAWGDRVSADSTDLARPAALSSVRAKTGTYSVLSNGGTVAASTSPVVRLANFTVATLPAGLSFSMWIYRTGNSGNDGFLLAFAGLVLWFAGGSNATINWCFSGQSSFTGNTWVHVVGTISNTNVCNLFVNNMRVVTDLPPQVGIAYPTNASASSNWLLGVVGVSGNTFNGHVDDLQLYNTVLTAAQVNALYNGGAGGTVL